MTTSVLRISILALGLAAAPTMLRAQDAQSVVGVWAVSVTVRDCQTGALVRTVHSLQSFLPGGSETETANTAHRGISLGSWSRVTAQTFNAVYWFFRYTPDGNFASFASANNMMTLSDDGSQFTATGTIQDFDANNMPISTNCVTQTANRLPTSLGPGNMPGGRDQR